MKRSNSILQQFYMSQLPKAQTGRETPGWFSQVGKDLRNLFGIEEEKPEQVVLKMPQKIRIQDTRTKSLTTGQKINPNRDLVSGEYPSNRIYNIVKAAKRYGIDPYDALAIDLQETGLGTSKREGNENVGHILMNRWNDRLVSSKSEEMDDPSFQPYDTFGQVLATKMQEADRLGITDPYTRLQVYNGLGKISGHTEKDYHGFKMKSIYGVPIPAEGIDMRKNPLYGKRVVDLRDNVLKSNKDLEYWIRHIKKTGGPIVDPRGQWAYPGRDTIVPTASGGITMQDVPYPVYGQDETGYGQMMYPGGEYTFPGQMVYEKPIMQTGGESVMKGKDYVEQWMNSPMYQQMLSASAQGPEYDRINQGRIAGFKVPTVISKAFDLAGTNTMGTQKHRIRTMLNATTSEYEEMMNAIKAAADNPKSKQAARLAKEALMPIVTGWDIGLNPMLKSGSHDYESVLAHEHGHTTDTPFVGGDLSKMSLAELTKAKANIQKPYIPASDIEKMRKYHEGKVTTDYGKYVSRPEETRQFLNQVRYLGKTQGVYDPFSQKITPEQYKKIMPLQNTNPMGSLREIYSDDQILDMLNSISIRNKSNNIPFAKSGGQHGGLDRWFAERWVDVKTGKACGRQEGEKRRSYPACRPSRRVNEDTPKTSGELSSSEREKFKRSKTSSERINYQHRRKEYGGETNEQDMANKPNNPSLWSKAKSLAKQKFDVYPSAYANGWAAKWYKGKGGTWRKAEYGMQIPYMEDGGKPEWLIEAQLEAQGYSGDALQQKMSTMAQGGEPQNEGFQALPEEVQRKIMEAAFGGYIPEMMFGGPAQQAAIDRLQKREEKLVAKGYKAVDEGREKKADRILGRAAKVEDRKIRLMESMSYGGDIPEMAYGGAAQQAAIAIAMKKAGKKPKMPFGGLLLPGIKKRIEEAKPMLMQMAPMLMGAPPMPMMAKGGDPDGEMALGQIDAAIMKLEQLRKFIQPDSDLEPWVNSKLTLMDDYASAVSDYMMFNSENQEQMPEMGRGGYTVTRSNDRKGKTHKVTGPDGTVKYFGDSKLGQHPKDPERKKAFYARHKKNLDANPYFRAFARATWRDGGSTFSGNAFYEMGGPAVGDEMEVTPEQLQMLKDGGYTFEII